MKHQKSELRAQPLKAKPFLEVLKKMTSAKKWPTLQSNRAPTSRSSGNCPKQNHMNPILRALVWSMNKSKTCVHTSLLMYLLFRLFKTLPTKSTIRNPQSYSNSPQESTVISVTWFLSKQRQDTSPHRNAIWWHQPVSYLSVELVSQKQGSANVWPSNS